MQSYKESSFSRSAQNVKKFGAYYTDPAHCRRIGRLFDFDRADEICVLEPSIGDGTAVLAVTGKRKHCKIYGVEIQKETYKEFLEGNENFTCILNEDFLRGVKISHGSFSFCFANPPYGELKDEHGGSKRLEELFLEKMTGYLKNGAYLALVIPFSVFTSEKFFRQVMNRYEICAYYRFEDKEYEKYHQIVAILRKKKCNGYLRALFEEQYQKASQIDNYPYLPKEEQEIDGRYEVLESRDADMEYFTTVLFHPEEAAKHLENSSLFNNLGDSLFQKTYRGCDLNQPIVPVSKDIAYLLAVTGGGQGFAGDEEEGTLHLQRGVAKRVEEDKVNIAENSVNPQSITSTSYTKIAMNIVENDGKITQL